jgi:hypothetical protein
VDGGRLTGGFGLGIEVVFEPVFVFDFAFDFFFAFGFFQRLNLLKIKI